MHRMRMMPRCNFFFSGGGFKHAFIPFLFCTFLFSAQLFASSGSKTNSSNAAIALNYRTVGAGGFPKIVSEVAVFDQNNIPIGGLTEADFSVFEDGVLQLPIKVEEFGGDSGGVSVVLVMDVSGSMRDEIDQAKDAAITFVNLLGEFDQAALVSFWGDVQIEQDFTQNKTLLIDAINGLKLDHGTSVYDATVTATEMLQPIEGKRAIVLLSDGRDNSSNNSLDDVLALVSTSEIPIYAIGLGLKKNGREQLIDIAEASGGIFYDSPTADELEGIYREIAFLLSQSYYLVTYTTSNCTADGTRRQVRIEVRHQGMTGSGVNNYTAPGHFAPLIASSQDQPSPGEVFSLILAAGNGNQPLFNLHSLSIRLRFPPKYLNFQPSVRPGALLGAGDFSLNFTLEAGDSALVINFQKNTGAGPVTGSGALAEIDFTVDPSVPDGEPYHFEIEILSSRDGNGCAVALQTAPFNTTGDGMLVWPGDTNANGVVELTDVLVLGVYWEIDGPLRPGPEDQLFWMAHLAKSYNIVQATHADGDGGGQINERDIIPIGLNWGKNQSDAVAEKPRVTSGILPEGELDFKIEAHSEAGHYTLLATYHPENEASIAGATFQVRFPRDKIKILSVREGDFWQTKPLQIDKIQQGVLSVGQMLPASSQIQKNGGHILKVHFASESVPNPNWFTLSNLALVSSDGRINEPGISTGTGDPAPSFPEAFRLFAAYPNPFSRGANSRYPGNPRTTIRFFLARESHVTLSVFDLHGRRVRTLVSERRFSGDHKVIFNAGGLPSGVYFYTLEVDGRFRQTKRLVLLK